VIQPDMPTSTEKTGHECHPFTSRPSGQHIYPKEIFCQIPDPWLTTGAVRCLPHGAIHRSGKAQPGHQFGSGLPGRSLPGVKQADHFC